jgi:hypothetical protein
VQAIFLQLGSPQTDATPPPAHVAGAVQPPQSSMPPHPSPMVPQKRDAPALQVMATHPVPATHNPEVLQTWVPSHPPQLFARPQPSPTVPQYLPVATVHSRGVHPAPDTHSPPSHCWPVGHIPQSSVPAQPLPMTPQ